MKKVHAPRALDAARLGRVQAGALSINPILKPQPDPWIPPVILIPVIINPIGY